jgi:alkanesulfonate monooxygenase SsuD/methylene tetrahydromethanopterin reductase-like flavin-dependent oxidoreductase (luciferase family)
LVRDGDGPSFGLWYDFRQRLPLGDYAAFYAECLEEIEEGERLGFTGAWLSEHHFVDDGYLPSPLVVAAAVAARTETITIGTNILLLPMHHPLRVAEDAAAVDLVSGGRFVLGVGQGYVQHEFETLGYERRYRPSLFEEGIEIIRQALGGGPHRLRGEAVALRRPALRAAALGQAADLRRRVRRPGHRPGRASGGRVPGLGRGRGVRGDVPEGPRGP